MELGGHWHEMYGAAPPPTSAEYPHPHHLYNPEPAYPPLPLPTSAEYNHPHHLYNPELAYPPQPPPTKTPTQHHYPQPPPPPPTTTTTTTQHYYPPPPLSSSSYYFPDPNPSYAPFSGVAESSILLRYPPLDRPSPPLRYSSLGGYYDGHRPSAYEFAAGGHPPASLSAARVGASTLPPYYYGGGRGGEPYSLSVRETILQYGVDPSRYAADIPRTALEPNLMVVGPKRTPHHNFRPNPSSKVIAKGGRGGKKIAKSGRKITNVKLSAYCEVCKVQCDTEEVLKCHKQGKKHKANLQKLQESITAKPAAATATDSETTEAPAASDKDKAAAEQSKRKDAPATAEELEAKKQRVLEGGAAVDGVKVCTVCNVVVNSPKVFEYHVRGQKHAAMVKQQEEQLNAPDVPGN